MSHSNAYATREERARGVVEACEKLVKDHSITAYGRQLARQALEDARALIDEEVAERRANSKRLRTALDETDQLARAGETVGYESAYRILRRAVAEVLEEPCPGCDRRGEGIRQQPDGALVCSVCGRTVVSAERERVDVP